MAVTPDWARFVLSGEMPDAEGDDAEKQRAEMEALKTVEDCEAVCLEKLPALFEAILAIPDEKFKETRWLPFQGGRDFTFEEMMDYPRWNFNYHLGQIGYIQTLYGDMEDH
ncbi:hypothetical protein EON79_17645 [bacterium]|nr:MAG: hypothetical protein EON79_17645 [bacterium]